MGSRRFRSDDIDCLDDTILFGEVEVTIAINHQSLWQFFHLRTCKAGHSKVDLHKTLLSWMDKTANAFRRQWLKLGE